MLRKKLDMIIANDVSRDDIGFGSDDNAATAYWKSGEISFNKMSKALLAVKLVEKMAELLA